jgi:hypothetical protein
MWFYRSPEAPHELLALQDVQSKRPERGGHLMPTAAGTRPKLGPKPSSGAKEEFVF